MREICRKLEELGHTTELDDLYKSQFDPVLSARERKSYYEHVFDDSGVTEQIQQLLNADALVIIFPTRWFGFPAILKGWFDRVWAPTFAYDHADDFGPIKPRLNRLKQTFVVTTLGAPWWVDFFILRKPLKRIIKHALLGACAKKCKLTYISFYQCEKIDPKTFGTFSSKIESELIKAFK